MKLFILLLITAFINPIFSQSNDDNHWYSFGSKVFGNEDPLGTDLIPEIWEVRTNGADIYIGGKFTHVKSAFMGCITKYSTVRKTWTDLDSGVGFFPNTLHPTIMDFEVLPNGEVFIGDGFYDDAGGPRGYLNYNVQITSGFGAKFSNGIWSPYSTPNRNSRLFTGANGKLYLFEKDLWVWNGGNFTKEASDINYLGGDPRDYKLIDIKGDSIYFRAYEPSDNTQSWVKIFNTKTKEITKISLRGAGQPGGFAFKCIEIDNAGNVYVGGEFSRLIDLYTNNIAKWNVQTQKWSALGLGLNDEVNSLQIGIMGELYAGGKFKKSGDSNLNFIAVWDSSRWKPLGSGVDSTVNKMYMDPFGRLFITGLFKNVGGKSAELIAVWDKATPLEKPALVVNSLDDKLDRSCDDGHCSFRDALYVANLSSDRDTIKFRIPGTGERIIEVDSALPDISEPLIIDGTSQPGYTNSPLIRIDGNKLKNRVWGLNVIAGNTEIKGISITRFGDFGIIFATEGDNAVYGCNIGTDAKGSDSLQNRTGGILIENGASNTIIGDFDPGLGNKIFDGVQVWDSTTNRVKIQNNILKVPESKMSNLPLILPLDLGGNGPSCNCWVPKGGINNGIAPPRILKLTADTLEGMTLPGATVEVYKVNESGTQHGRYFARSVEPISHGTANNKGFFSIKSNIVEGTKVVISATDKDGNTSEFSQLKRPVVFAPGIGGSWLIGQDGTELWLPDGSTDATQNNNLARMSLNPDGSNIERVRENGIIESVLGISEVYGPFFKWLGNQGGYDDFPHNNLLNDIWRFPYDFRLDLDARADIFKELIDEITSHKDYYPVSCEADIVAHSMGGLISSLYLRKNLEHGRDHIHRLITVGTPYLGAVQALAGHTKGYIFGLEDVPVYGFDFDIEWGRMLQMSRNMTASYALAPSRFYWNASTQFESGNEYVVPDLSGNPINSYNSTLDFITSPKSSRGLDRNLALWNLEQTKVHDLVDDWRTWNQPPQIFRLVGIKGDDDSEESRRHSTTVSWHLNPRFSAITSQSNITQKSYRKEPGDSYEHILYRSLIAPVLGYGDGTVPLSSANLGASNISGKTDYSGVYDSDWVEEFEYFPCDHTGLTYPSCRNRFIGSVERIGKILDGGYMVNTALLELIPPSRGEELIYIYANSPVIVHVYDANGKYIGPVSKDSLNKIKYLIPDVYYYSNVLSTVISLPGKTEYKLIVEVSNDSTIVQFTRLLPKPNNKMLNILFDDVRLNQNSTVKFEFIASGTNDNQPLKCDFDGDGTFEKTQLPVESFESGSPKPAMPMPFPFSFHITAFKNDNKNQTAKITFPDIAGPNWNWQIKKSGTLLVPSSNSGTTPKVLDITVNSKGLAVGEHFDTMTVALSYGKYKIECPILFNINVYDKSEISTIQLAPEYVTINPNKKIQFIAKAYDQSGKSITSTLNWNATGGNIDQSGMFTAGDVDGKYIVTVQNNDLSVKDTAVVMIDRTVAVDESEKEGMSSEPEINIYPNPCTDKCNILVNFPSFSNIRIRVTNTLGVEVLPRFDGFYSKGNHEFTVNCPGLASGIYFITFEFEDSSGRRYIKTKGCIIQN